MFKFQLFKLFIILISTLSKRIQSFPMKKNSQSQCPKIHQNKNNFNIGSINQNFINANELVQQTFDQNQTEIQQYNSVAFQVNQNKSETNPTQSINKKVCPQKYVDFQEQQITVGQSTQKNTQSILNSKQTHTIDQKNISQQQSQSNVQTGQNNKKINLNIVFVGVLIALCFSLFLSLVVIVEINKLSISNDTRFSRDFPTWRGVAIFIFYIWVLGFNMWMFQKFKINYRKIFGFNQDHFPRALSLFKIAGLQTSCFLILFCLYILAYTEIYVLPIIDQQYFALISWVFFVFCLFMPIPYFSNKGRFFALKLLLKSILSPFIGVTFPIAWMTDQLVSMAIPLKDFQYTLCYYAQFQQMSQDYTYCQDKHRVSIVVIVTISFCTYRVFQCIRQGYDKGTFFMTPFFFNSIKYVATIIAALFAFQYRLGEQSFLSPWLIFAIISTLYSYIWDIKMDWGFLQRNAKYPLLREKLMYGPSRNYYLICAANLLMKWVWILSFSPFISNICGNVNLFYLVAGLIQILRRGVWNLLKFQFQHLHLQRTNKIQQFLQKNIKNKINQFYCKLQILILRANNKLAQTQQIIQSELQQLKNCNQSLKQLIKNSAYEVYEKQQFENMQNLLTQAYEIQLKLQQRMKNSMSDAINSHQVQIPN